MDGRVWVEGRWVPGLEIDGILYFKGRYIERGSEGTYPPKPDIVLHHMELSQLIAFLTANGYVKPQLAENRAEDLRIIHRLIDTVQGGRMDARPGNGRADGGGADRVPSRD